MGMTIMRRRQARRMARAALIATPTPAYRSVLIALRPSASPERRISDRELLAMARRISTADSDRELLVVHELPLTEELDAPIPEREEFAQSWLDAIRSATERKGVPILTNRVRSRAAGRAICQEAAARECDAIVLYSQLRHRPGGAIFGRTVDYVVRHAPCDVAVLSYPTG